MMQRRNSLLSDRRGSILLMILVLIIVVSYVLTQFMSRAQVEVQGEGYYVERSRLRLHAWSMMELAVAVLADVKEIDGALYAPSQGWGDPVEYARFDMPDGLNARFEFVDESAKMGINDLDEGSLFLLFDELGFDLIASQQLTNSLLDWIDEDDETRIDGAETKEYSSQELEVNPSNKPLATIGELASVYAFRDLFFDEDGIPKSQFSQLERNLTTYPVTALNVNSASPLALRAFAGLDDIQIETLYDYLEGFDGALGTEDDNYFASSDEISAIIGEGGNRSAISHEITVLTIRVTVQESGSAYTLIGTLNTQEAPSGGGVEDSDLQYPFLFLELREEPGMNNA